MSPIKSKNSYNNKNKYGVHKYNAAAATKLKISFSSTFTTAHSIAWIIGLIVCSLNGFKQVAALKGKLQKQPHFILNFHKTQTEHTKCKQQASQRYYCIFKIDIVL